MPDSDQLFVELSRIMGAGGVLSGDSIEPRYCVDWTAGAAGRPALVVRPASTAEVAATVQACRRVGRAIVPQGGRTGMVRGGLARPGEIILSLERMSAIESLDPVNATLTVGAGAILETCQQAAAEAGFSLPLDLGGRGSCTIGGVIATNAGGNRVLRYGMARDSVLGLEAVLGDGSTLGSMNRMIKNNAGYDLKQLLIGSEGTLGIVTRAVLRLRPAVRSENVALCAVPSFDGAVRLLRALNMRLGGQVSAFELMWRDFYRYVTGIAHAPGAPLPRDYPFYALVEMQGGNPDEDDARFNAALEAAMEDGMIADAVIAPSLQQVRGIWAVRDAIGPALAAMPAFAPFDIAIPVGRMEWLVAQMRSLFAARWPGREALFFGHIGDMNLHAVLVLREEDDVDAVESAVYALLAGEHSSISGEHGVGVLKKPYLALSRTAGEIDLMRRLKVLLDPDGILSPGRIFDPAA